MRIRSYTGSCTQPYPAMTTWFSIVPENSVAFVADPLGHIADISQGVMQINMERVRVNFTSAHYLTIIISGFESDEADDGRYYIDFEDI